MGTKIISIREEVYENLKSLKREDESISDVVERLITKKKN
jgi:predicted CopG family antitoxin